MTTRAELATMIDHTLLKPEATAEQVNELAREAGELGTFSICVSPSRLTVQLPDGVKLATVCGFPSGAHEASVKAAEAADSVAASRSTCGTGSTGTSSWAPTRSPPAPPTS